ncbi:hypothetical protein V8G54_023517 [Vigna mungo]|uniref:Uncharacterized protein n=1 Tax=Vigna mungo TaxID=3915 RepID=A0AAQ3N531_VIGMU
MDSIWGLEFGPSADGAVGRGEANFSFIISGGDSFTRDWTHDRSGSSPLCLSSNEDDLRILPPSSSPFTDQSAFPLGDPHLDQAFTGEPTIEAGLLAPRSLELTLRSCSCCCCCFSR